MATSNEGQSQANKPEKGDSKDFVEHLRTVHFALIATCLALVVILQFPSAVSIREAIRQLNTIVDATDVHVWKQTWIRDVIMEQQQREKFSSDVCNRTDAFDLTVDGLDPTIRLVGNNWYTIGPKLSTDNEFENFWDSGVEFRDVWLKAPSRLDDFIRIWNGPFLLLCPLGLSSQGIIQSIGLPDKLVAVRKSSASSDKAIRKAHLDRAQEDDVFWYSFPRSEFAASDGLVYEAEYQVNSAKLVLIPASQNARYPIDFRGKLVKEYPQHNWLHADFKDAFYELDQATTGFQDLDFGHMKSILQQNEKNSKEAFQVFGVTFPIETTTRWGTFIIIVIQFYFLLHFMEYRKRRTQTKPDVAWIGVYSSVGAQILFCATGLAVPVGVIAFVCVKAGLLQQMPVRNFVLCSIAVAISLIFSLLTAREHFKKETLTPTSPRATAG